jgi:hypothetical protein
MRAPGEVHYFLFLSLLGSSRSSWIVEPFDVIEDIGSRLHRQRLLIVAPEHVVDLADALRVGHTHDFVFAIAIAILIHKRL